MNDYLWPRKMESSLERNQIDTQSTKISPIPSYPKHQRAKVKIVTRHQIRLPMVIYPKHAKGTLSEDKTCKISNFVFIQKANFPVEAFF